MRRTRILLTALVLVGLTASSTSAGTEARHAQVLTVRATTSTWWLETDAPPFGASRGDVIFGSDVLRGGTTPQSGTGGSAGRSFWRLVYRTGALAALSETAYLGHGSVTCRGTVRNGARVNRLRVVRGSGVFAGATGVCETRSSSSPGSPGMLKTYRLSLP